MKIAVYSDIPLDGRAGGGGIYIKSVSDELRRLGHSVSINDGFNRPRLFSNHYAVEMCKDADVHFFNEPSTVFPLSLAQSSKPINRVITFHAPVAGLVFKNFYSSVIRLFYRKANLVLATTKRSEQFLKSYGVNATVVPLWADDFFKSSIQNRYARKPYVLSVCLVDRFHTYKNYPMISRLAKTLRSKFNLPLLHVGSNDFVLPYVTHLGKVSRSELRQLYQNALLLVLPSTGVFEGFGIVAAEALTCNTPVLVSDCSGISEFLDDCFVSSLANFENKLTSMIRELIQSNRSIIDKAFSESLKFSFSNCTRTANMIINCTEKSLGHTFASN